jgi:hypothetical protein
VALRARLTTGLLCREHSSSVVTTPSDQRFNSLTNLPVATRRAATALRDRSELAYPVRRRSCGESGAARTSALREASSGAGFAGCLGRCFVFCISHLTNDQRSVRDLCGDVLETLGASLVLVTAERRRSSLCRADWLSVRSEKREYV